jgi:hypothetical protein
MRRILEAAARLWGGTLGSEATEDVVSAVVLVFVGGAFIWAGFTRPAQWLCPRCTLPFFCPEAWGGTSGGGLQVSGVNPFWPAVQLCVNCGLPKWCPRDPDDSAERSAGP